MLPYKKEQGKNDNFIQERMNDICASVQRTIVNILMNRLKLASEMTGIRHVAIAGGVSANSEIRRTLKEMEESHGWKTYIPKFEYTTDNAAMIGIVGYLKYQDQDFDREDAGASSRLDMEK